MALDYIGRVTLNLVIAAPWGLWLSTDFRVTDRFRGKSTPRDDHWSPKYFQALTAKHEALAITYTGIAEVVAIEPQLAVVPAGVLPMFDNVPGRKRKVPVSEWLSWILAGEGKSVDHIVHRIASEAADVPEFKHTHHIFTGVATSHDGARVVQVTNVDIRSGDNRNGIASEACFERRPLTEFNVLGKNILTPAGAMAGAVGLGAGAISRTDQELLQHVARKRPRNHRDYFALLAGINARAAARDPHKSVSPACQVMYLNPNPEAAATDDQFDGENFENGQTVPEDFEWRVFRSNLFGVDILSLSRAVFKEFEQEHKGGQSGAQ